jgi:intergrase/recombinase
MEEEIKQFSDFLKQQRDEINLKLHLGGMEAKEEMKNAEEIWESFLEKVDVIGDETQETTFELIESAKSVGDDLKTAYEKLVSSLT